MVTVDSSQPPLRVLENTLPGPGHRQYRLALRLHMAEYLHASLDPQEVLKRFSAELQRELGITSIGFRTDSGEQLLEADQDGLHSCQFDLKLGECQLGILQLRRRRRFGERELDLMELMVGCAVSPLHNALQHRSAMRYATRDALTGIGNRMALEIAAEHEIALARRHHTATSLLVVDIDHFKRINDERGHAAGDRALVEMAALLRHTCRDSDNLFRFGGEEFVLLLSQTDTEGALAMAERIRDRVARHWSGDGNLTVSVGVAALEAGDTLGSWFDRADRALYVGKRNGRNRVVVAGLSSIA